MVFLELFWSFFNDPVDVGNLISGSSAFSKSSLNIWKFSFYILFKPDLENFEHYFASVWDECNCVVFWTFFGIVFPWWDPIFSCRWLFRSELQFWSSCRRRWAHVLLLCHLILSQIGKGVCQDCLLSLCLFNLYAENIMRNAKLDEAHAGINNLR